MPNTWIDKLPAAKLGPALAQLGEHADRYADHLRYADGDDRFALWLALVDKRVWQLSGHAVSLFDLADWNSRDEYEAGTSPVRGAYEALANDDVGACILEDRGIEVD